MKKSVIAVVGALLVSSLFLGGCKLTPEQSKVVAQNAGVYSAVIWIAVDNPTSSQITEVKGVLDIIKEKASAVKAGQTFTEVIYPELVKVIDTKIPVQDRPLVKVASLSILNGLDTLFAMNPEWKTPEDLALDIVNSYVDGAKSGLSMQETGTVMKQARATANARAKMFVK
jgi:hypothetical protein